MWGNGALLARHRAVAVETVDADRSELVAVGAELALVVGLGTGETPGWLAEVETKLRGRGRVLLRYSGTEQLARVMVEGEDAAEIETQANRLAEAVKRALG